MIPLFHYALKPGGYLFLGPSENLSSHRELFRPLNARHRISQRLPTAVSAAAILGARQSPLTMVRPPNVPTASETDMYLLMQRIILDEFAPKALVIDEEGQIICASGNLEKYLAVTSGAFHNNIRRLVREGLRVGLRATLAESIRLRRQITHDGLSLHTDKGVQRVMLTVQPMPHMGEDTGLFLVVFQDVGLPYKEQVSPLPPSEDAAALIEQLERELLTTREDLERTVQDLEAANEEMKSSNEELLSMNEELQSANEELETSKEEVQAANDRLIQVNTDLENLLASTQVGTIFLSDDLLVRRITPAVTAIYNILPGDSGRQLSHFTHKAKLMPRLPALGDIYASEKPLEHEIEMLDGSWYMRRILPYRNQEGKSEGILLMFTDITARKHSEMYLRKNIEQLRLAMDASNMGHWNWSRETDYTTFSERARQILGLTGSDSFPRAYIYERIVEEDQPRVSEVGANARLLNTDYDIEYRVYHPDGKIVWVHAMGRCEYDDSGQFLGIIGVIRDITDFKLSQQALVEADRRKDEFLATLAHELRNPLAPISNGLQVMRMGSASKKPEIIRETQQMMERQVRHMVRLVDDLLDISRITRGQITLNKQRLSLSDIFQAAIEISTPLIEARGHQLDVELPEEKLQMMGDATRLSQIVANLVNNAAKYTPQSGKIRLKAQRKGTNVLITVKDNGIGIPADKLASIFDMFVQVDNTLERSQGGLGIGLTLVRKLVELHGGTVNVKSAGRDKGSEFMVSLPLAV